MHRLDWSLVTPVAACLVLAAIWTQPLGWMLLSLVAVALIAAVLVGVHHAEVVAHRVGEPFGTLILAMAVTVIELALIGSIMLAGGPAAGSLARDTVFATVMIVCNGVVGLCLLLGAIRHHELPFRVEGAGHALSVLAILTTLTLVLPTFTTTTPGSTYSESQLAFAGVSSLLLYGVFVFVQTVRHRGYFLPVSVGAEEEHAAPPPLRIAMTSLGLLFVSLIAVVGLAKMLAPSIEATVKAADAPAAVVGIVIALLVLLPETLAALRAATRNRMQTSLNLALGSALATIGLTIPAVAALSIVLEMPLELGLAPTETVLLALTLLVTTITLASGRSTVLHGAVHLILFGAFLFLAVVPWGLPMKRPAIVVASLAFAAAAYGAETTVTLSAVDAKGTGASVGTVRIVETRYGLAFYPALTGLPPGLHGFHVHENPSCAPGVRDGVSAAALAAGGHLDPQATKRHGEPWGDGHLGDLPALYVVSDGSASNAVLAPRLKLADLVNRSLMVHAGGDNHSDHPAPLGGGGDRLACGVIGYKP